MITAIDTNVLVDFFSADPQFGELAKQALREAALDGRLIISEIVHTEFLTAYVDQPEANRQLSAVGIEVEPSSTEQAFVAASAWRAFRSRGGQSRRIAADFLIAAHALCVADRLITRDAAFYKRNFPKLAIIDPSASLSK